MRRPHLNLLRRIGEHAVPGGEAPSAIEILGANHPLVRVVDLRRDMRRQSLATAVALAIGTVGFAFGTRWGLPLLIAAALIQLVLAAGIALLAQLQHERALDLIIEGRDGLPLPALERERRRLQRPRRRASLAHALEDLVRTAERWPTLLPSARPVFDPRQIRRAAPELRAIAALLRSSPVDARGLALVERLLTSGASPLYDREPAELRRALERIRAELDRADPAARSARGS
jgi:hypothetical protein